MRVNWNTQVVAENVVLRPYMSSMVSKYHAWMEDEWLRDMTASERLSVEEEMKMQAEWRDDDSKLTFIVFDAATARAAPSTADDTAASTADDTAASTASTADWSAGMVGDVNLFFLDDDDDDDDEEEVEEDDEDDADAAEPSLPSAASASPGENSAVPSANVPSHTAEIMVMTAEATFRKRGFAKRAASMMMRYANETLGVTAFVAKISMSNKASLRLFRSELGFSVQKEVPAFEEIHLLLKAPKPGAVASTASGGWERVLALTDSWGVERFANPEALP